MSDLEWREPPTVSSGGKPAKIALAAIALREHPGQWALITGDSGLSNRTYASYIKTARITAWRPAGSFDAVSRKRPDGQFDIYARYVGENGEHA